MFETLRRSMQRCLRWNPVVWFLPGSILMLIGRYR